MSLKLLLVVSRDYDFGFKVTLWIVLSLLICICLYSADPSDSTALTANFIFVARDYKTGKAAPVNRITPETEREKLLYEAAEAKSKVRKRKERDEDREIENGERSRFEALLAQGRIFCDMPALADRDSILLKDTCLENSLICQPQQRNVHGRIFGGFLMHRAFELAFSTAYAFAGMMPSFVEADHVDFLKPVSFSSHGIVARVQLRSNDKRNNSPIDHAGGRWRFLAFQILRIVHRS